MLALEAQIVSGDGLLGKMKGLTAAGNFAPFVIGPAGTTALAESG